MNLNTRFSEVSICKNENIQITEIGSRILNRFSNLQYIESIMYNNICDANYFKTTKIDDLDIDYFPLTYIQFEILRLFIKETAEIEKKEIANILSKDYEEYYKYYKNSTICTDIYENVIPPLVRITSSELEKQKLISTNIRNQGETIKNMINDYENLIEWLNNINNEFVILNDVVKAKNDLNSLSIVKKLQK